MKELVTTMTQRGQVTVPAEVRHKFGLKPGDKVVFILEGDTVIVMPAKYSLESVFGSVKPINHPEDFDQLIREAKEERTRRKYGPRALSNEIHRR